MNNEIEIIVRNAETAVDAILGSQPVYACHPTASVLDHTCRTLICPSELPAHIALSESHVTDCLGCGAAVQPDTTDFTPYFLEIIPATGFSTTEGRFSGLSLKTVPLFWTCGSCDPGIEVLEPMFWPPAR